MYTSTCLCAQVYLCITLLHNVRLSVHVYVYVYAYVYVCRFFAYVRMHVIPPRYDEAPKLD